MALDVEYVLPLSWSSETRPDAVSSMAAYLRRLSGWVDITVVDGSAPEQFERHGHAWRRWARHVPPQPWPGRNGKVAGVVTGVQMARHEYVVIADDDVRYSGESLAEVVRPLAEGAHLVRPQNVLSPLCWHARWDTARSLMNRAVGHDYPGTHALCRSAFLAVGGYDGDALFENLELARTFQAAGLTIRDLPGTYVPREPPTTAHFWSQRVRQAYDDFAQPARLVAELALLPALAWELARSPRSLALLGGVVIGGAEVGRRRAGGRAAYESTAALWAVPWSLERAVCVWLAAIERARGGAMYRGTRVTRAASSLRHLKTVLGDSLDATSDAAEGLRNGQATATAQTPPFARARVLP